MGFLDLLFRKKKQQESNTSIQTVRTTQPKEEIRTEEINVPPIKPIEKETRYDHRGYDKNGYNEQGFNVFGFTKEHIDKDRLDYKGYDLEGYDRFGYSEDGFDRTNHNKYGHTRDEYDEDGYLLSSGFNDAGFNRYGYDSEGYDEEGLKDGYDREGYTLDGFDKDGFNRQNLTIDGYDRQGYKDGYNRKGLDRYGMDRYGYFEDGYNLAGLDRDGRDREGYDIFGFDIDGHTREYNLFFINDQKKIEDLKPGDTIYSSIYGPMEIVSLQKMQKSTYFTLIAERLNARPRRSKESIYIYLSQNPPKKIQTDRYGTLALFQMDQKEFAIGKDFLQEVRRFKNEQFGEHLYLNLPKDWMQAEASFSMEEFKKETAYLKEVHHYISDIFIHQLKKEIDARYNAQYSQENPMRLVNPYSRDPYIYTAEDYYLKESEKVKRKPYIGSIVLNGETLYISEDYAIPEKNIINMADKRIQYYYQYEFYANNNEVNLECVRSFTLMYDRLFMYFDKFNRKKDNISMDQLLIKALMEHRNNKFVSNIIETIQANQFEIIKQDLNKNLLILGCAGSGKTMILFHRLYYIRFNYPEFPIENMILLAPTSLLTSQTKGLVNQLHLDAMKQYTIPAFMNSIYESYCLEYEDSFEDIDFTKEYTYEHFNKEWLLLLQSEVKQKMDDLTYIKSMNTKITNDFKNIEHFIASDEIDFKQAKINTVYDLYTQAVALCEKYSKENIKLILEGLETKIQSISVVSETIQCIEFLKPFAIFQTMVDESSVFANTKEEVAKLNACRRYMMPLNKVFRNQNFEELKAKHFENAHDLFTYVLQQSDLSRETVNKTMDKILRMKQCRIDEIYDYLLTRFDEINKYKHYVVILKDVLKTNRLRKIPHYQNNILFGRDIEDYNELQAIFDFYDALHFTENQHQIYLSLGVSSPFDFMELYMYAEDHRSRFQQFIHGNKKAYLIDFIYHFINPSYSIYDYKKVIGYDELVAILYILSFSAKAASYEKKLILVDEFKDLSIAEIELLQRAYPKSIFNFYGDVNQCMNPKGIHSEIERIQVLPDIQTYTLQSNYRNSYEITNFVNQNLNLDFEMLPIGVKGLVSTIYKDSEAIRNTLLNTIKLDDRAAFIVKDKASISKDFMATLGIIDISYREMKEVPRGRLVLYSIQEAKGLEFEIVLVDDSEMTKNEKYVAYTRALDCLYILKKDTDV